MPSSTAATAANHPTAPSMSVHTVSECAAVRGAGTSGVVICRPVRSIAPAEPPVELSERLLLPGVPAARSTPRSQADLDHGVRVHISAVEDVDAVLGPHQKPLEQRVLRSDTRRVGKECGWTGRY